MIKFIYVCMSVVLLSMLGLSASFMFDGINDSYREIVARSEANLPQGPVQIADSGLSWDEIYAVRAPDMEIDLATMTPEQLNNIETAAGEDSFSQGFTGRAPAALADPSSEETNIQAF